MTGNELYEEYCNECPFIMGYREFSYEDWLQRQVIELRENAVNKNCNMPHVSSLLNDPPVGGSVDLNRANNTISWSITDDANITTTIWKDVSVGDNWGTYWGQKFKIVSSERELEDIGISYDINGLVGTLTKSYPNGLVLLSVTHKVGEFELTNEFVLPKCMCKAVS